MSWLSSIGTVIDGAWSGDFIPSILSMLIVSVASGAGVSGVDVTATELLLEFPLRGGGCVELKVSLPVGAV